MNNIPDRLAVANDWPVSALILAGGQSRRMGQDKAFVEFKGAPLLMHVIERVRTVADEILISANDPAAYARFGVQVVPDVYPGKGSLGGVFSGVQAARHPRVLAVACDMPFLNLSLLQYLISLAPQFDVVVPRAQDLVKPAPQHDKDRKPRHPDRPLAKESDLHPLHAVYSKECLTPIRERLMQDDLRMIGFYEAVRVRIVGPDEVERFDPQHLSFFNANAPGDLELARKLEDR